MDNKNLLEEIKKREQEFQPGYTLKFLQQYELINIIYEAIKYLTKTTNTNYNSFYGINNPITLAVKLLMDGKLDNTIIERKLSNDKVECIYVKDFIKDWTMLECYYKQVTGVKDI